MPKFDRSVEIVVEKDLSETVNRDNQEIAFPLKLLKGHSLTN
jgi:hypothetical protein